MCMYLSSNQAHLLHSISPFQMYFIFDLTRAPCQCTVLINRVGPPESPSLSLILFQQSWGCVQSWREVLRLQEHRLEVSQCVWCGSNPPKKQKKKNTRHPHRVLGVHMNALAHPSEQQRLFSQPLRKVRWKEKKLHALCYIQTCSFLKSNILYVSAAARAHTDIPKLSNSHVRVSFEISFE